MTRLALALARSRFLRFSFIGACGFVVDEAVLALMHKAIGLDPYSGRAISIFCAACFTWWGNRSLTFRDRAIKDSGRGIFKEWLRFMLSNAVGAIANYGTYTLLVRFAPVPFNNPFLAVALGVAAGLIFNFTLSHRFVFRAKEPPIP